MNKKFLTFGLIGMLAVVMVSAALVNYLSNTASVSVSVDSPLEMRVQRSDDGSNWFEHRTLSDMYGGETQDFNYKITNLADVTINGAFRVIISNTDNDVTCADFSSVKLKGVEAISQCQTGSGELYGKIYFDGTTNKTPGEEEIGTIEFTFTENVKPSTYDVSTYVAPLPA